MKLGRITISPFIKPGSPRLTINFHFAMARFIGVKNSPKWNSSDDIFYPETIKNVKICETERVNEYIGDGEISQMNSSTCQTILL